MLSTPQEEGFALEAPAHRWRQGKEGLLVCVQSGKYLRLEQGQPAFEAGATCSTFYVVLSGCIGLHGGDSLPQVSNGRGGRRRATLLSPDALCQGAGTQDAESEAPPEHCAAGMASRADACANEDVCVHKTGAGERAGTQATAEAAAARLE